MSKKVKLIEQKQKVYTDKEKEDLLTFLTDLKTPLKDISKYLDSDTNRDMIFQMNKKQLEKLHSSILNRMDIDWNFFLWLERMIYQG